MTLECGKTNSQCLEGPWTIVPEMVIVHERAGRSGGGSVKPAPSEMHPPRLPHIFKGFLLSIAQPTALDGNACVWVIFKIIKL